MGDRADPVDLSAAENDLRELHNALLEDPTQTTGLPARYYATVIEGPNKLAKRTERIEILTAILQDNIGAN